MPRNVRNFWIEAEVDGKATPVAFGPKNADGGFTLTVKMRDNGGSLAPVHIEGNTSVEGELTLWININGSLHTVTTRR